MSFVGPAGCVKASSNFPLDDSAGLDGPIFGSTHPMIQSRPTSAIASVKCVTMCEVT